jgi:hypothetical protein
MPWSADVLIMRDTPYAFGAMIGANLWVLVIC